MAKKSVLKYSKEFYYPEALSSGVLTEQEMRTEYARLRKIANKRLSTLEKAGYGNESIYQLNVDKYPPQSQLNERLLRFRLYQLSKFIETKTSTVTGQRAYRRNMVNALHEAGYDFVNLQNLKLFGEFMEHARIVGLESKLTSDRVAELFSYAQRSKVPYKKVREKFAEWAGNAEALQQIIKATASEDGMSSRELRRLLK